MQTKFPITLVVAMAKNGVIGINNTLPWRLKSDLAHFKALTAGKPIIMGRKTFESLGRPLPNRLNIVLTRSPITLEGATTVQNLASAITLAVNNLEQTQPPNPAIMVIGGGEIYKQFLPIADVIEITKVDCEPVGDTLFPNINIEEWLLTSQQYHNSSEHDDHAFTFERLERKSANS